MIESRQIFARRPRKSTRHARQLRMPNSAVHKILRFRSYRHQWLRHVTGWEREIYCTFFCDVSNFTTYEIFTVKIAFSNEAIFLLSAQYNVRLWESNNTRAVTEGTTRYSPYIVQCLSCFIQTRCVSSFLFLPNALWLIQGVTGGTDQTSGECSLGQTIPI